MHTHVTCIAYRIVTIINTREQNRKLKRIWIAHTHAKEHLHPQRPLLENDFNHKQKKRKKRRRKNKIKCLFRYVKLRERPQICSPIDIHGKLYMCLDTRRARRRSASKRPICQREPTSKSIAGDATFNFFCVSQSILAVFQCVSRVSVSGSFRLSPPFRKGKKKK